MQSLIKSNECTPGKRDLKPVRNVEQNFNITLLFESVRTEKIASMTKDKDIFYSEDLRTIKLTDEFIGTLYRVNHDNLRLKLMSQECVHLI